MQEGNGREHVLDIWRVVSRSGTNNPNMAAHCDKDRIRTSMSPIVAFNLDS
jgi:hypothetical protein